MAECNLDLMTQFSCEELRENLARTNLNIAADQRFIRDRNAKIHSLETQIANWRDEIAALRGELEGPVMPGPMERDRGQNRRPRCPGFGGIMTDVAEAMLRPLRNRQRIEELEREIARLETEWQEETKLKLDRIRSFNHALSGQSCIRNALWRKRCSFRT